MTDFRNDRVLLIDPSTGSVSGELATDREPKGMVLSRDGDRLWVSCWESGTVTVIDLATAARLETVSVGTNPRGLALAADGTRVYVVNSGSHDMHEIDAATMQVLRRAELVDKSYPRHVVAEAKGEFLYVSANGKRRVYRIGTDSLDIEGSVFVGECPRTIDLSPDERWLYTANYCSGSVTVVDLETMGTRKVAIDGLAEPVGLVVHPDGSHVYVTSWSTHFLFDLRVVDIGKASSDAGAVPGGDGW